MAVALSSPLSLQRTDIVVDRGRETMPIKAELKLAGPRPPENGSQSAKKNYAERLSRRLASKVANAMRSKFDGILPDQHGAKQESGARAGRGVKKLDVNYSTPELGLGLGISIKTVSFRDQESKRFTKNYTRVDNELRAEADDYHQRQPWAVLVAMIFLPVASLNDGKTSSFGRAVQTFRYRAKREKHSDPEDRFERIFIGVYEPDGESIGEDWYFDVEQSPPRKGRPVAEKRLTFDQMIEEVGRTYDGRNDPPFEWANETG